MPKAAKRRLAHLLHMHRTRPHFVAYAVKDLPALAPVLARMLFGLPLLTWTVRSEADRKTARALGRPDHLRRLAALIFGPPAEPGLALGVFKRDAAEGATDENLDPRPRIAAIALAAPVANAAPADGITTLSAARKKAKQAPAAPGRSGGRRRGGFSRSGMSPAPSWAASRCRRGCYPVTEYNWNGVPTGYRRGGLPALSLRFERMHRFPAQCGL